MTVLAPNSKGNESLTRVCEIQFSGQTQATACFYVACLLKKKKKKLFYFLRVENNQKKKIFGRIREYMKV